MRICAQDLAEVAWLTEDLGVNEIAVVMLNGQAVSDTQHHSKCGGAKRQMMCARKLYKRTEKGSYWRETKESRCQWMRGGPGDGVEATAGDCRDLPTRTKH